ncbi:MAG: FecR family protein [Parabacteroides gordonii]|uniref:FecR family protein n=1 Tax=Parabacteroides gordonii TaxID=574930 RepID=UPI003A884631
MKKKQQTNEQESIHLREQAELWFSSLAADDTHSYNVDRAFVRFKERSGISRNGFRIPFWVYVAAAVAALFIVSLTSYWQGGKQLERSFTDMVVEAPLGSKTKLILPDGTMVWLNAGSRLVYSQAFGVSSRNLDLQGEAYFEVVKKSGMPFKVRSKELNVEVLGTKFNFRNYPEDREVVVDLLEGKVALENCLKKMDVCFLEPSEKMVLNKQTGDLSISSAKVGHAKDWTDEVLFFDEDLLVDIAKELERSYAVTIRIPDDSLQSFRFYGSFNRRKQNIQDVLEVMSSTGLLKYEITRDNEIILKSDTK